MKLAFTNLKKPYTKHHAKHIPVTFIFMATLLSMKSQSHSVNSTNLLFDGT